MVQAMTIGEAETLLSAKGYVKSHNQAMIGSKMPGRVEKMLVEEGCKWRLDDLLAVLEHDDMIAQLESRKAMMARTQAELQEARSDLELKKIKAARRLQLQARGTITGEEVDQYLFDRDMAEARVKAIEAGIRAQEASIRESESLIENMKVYAPFSGTVTEKGAEVGETITPGGMGAASGRGSVVTLADLQNLEVETDISENLLSRVRAADPETGYEGQPAEITVSAVTDHRYKGRLVRIIPMGDRSRGTVKVDVEILDPDDRLFPELAATVHFLPDKNADNPNAGKTFLFVPKDAIFEEGGHSHVWVVDGKSTLRKRQVDVVVLNNDDLAQCREGFGAERAGAAGALGGPEGRRRGEGRRVVDGAGCAGSGLGRYIGHEVHACCWE